ncbi:MAG TPA: 23S rRNA (adenine(2503)-C(2))-methyltransferase RlmN [Desulfatiglandales bacterium]|nr:23S rRNA (adenine(2503)-C(2))-methyltransferase RlmN [Desulfatiglandales bacterium]
MLKTKIDLKGLDGQDTEKWAEGLGLDAFRGRQIRQWLFKRLASSFDDMTNLASSLRELLKEKANINHLERIRAQVSRDSTEKYLFRLIDGLYIESVLIPERGHYTLCISSQAGCAMGCAFCHTGRLGLKRNLTPAEIADQVIQAKRAMKEPDLLTNIVFMGMGEPLANYKGVLAAIKNMTAEDGMNFSRRKVTLSTCGLVPAIRRLGRDTTLNLAVSLNAADDETRNFLMPINRKYNLKTLITACRDFPLPNRRMITFEYILIHGVNDRPKDAINLAKLLAGLRAKINLIPLNPGPDKKMNRPSVERILEFQDMLIKRHFTAIIRKSKGQDISAACGQLSGEG